MRGSDDSKPDHGSDDSVTKTRYASANERGDMDCCVEQCRNRLLKLPLETTMFISKNTCPFKNAFFKLCLFSANISTRQWIDLPVP